MENRSSGWGLMGGLAIGVVGGFVAGYWIGTRPAEGGDRLSDALLDLRERSSELMESMRGNTETLLASTRQAIEEKMNLLNDAVEAGRRAAEYKRAELIEQEEI